MEHFNCEKIQYEGPDSKNALSFKHYNATEEVGGKAMKDHLRFWSCLLACYAERVSRSIW